MKKFLSIILTLSICSVLNAVTFRNKTGYPVEIQKYGWDYENNIGTSENITVKPYETIEFGAGVIFTSGFMEVSQDWCNYNAIDNGFMFFNRGQDITLDYIFSSRVLINTELVELLENKMEELEAQIEEMSDFDEINEFVLSTLNKINQLTIEGKSPREVLESL